MSSPSHQQRMKLRRSERIAKMLERKEDPREHRVVPEPDHVGGEMPRNTAVGQTQRITSQNDSSETMMPDNAVQSSSAMITPINTRNKRTASENSPEPSEAGSDTAVQTKSFRCQYEGWSIEGFAINFCQLSLSESSENTPENGNNPDETPST